MVGFCIDGRRDAEIDMIGENGLFVTVVPSTNEEPQMPISISMIVLSSQLVMPVADGVPKFDIARSCKLDLAATAGLTVDQSLKICMNDERKARRQLAAQWLKFPAASRAGCASQESIGGTPSYVSLQTCLQMGQWAR